MSRAMSLRCVLVMSFALFAGAVQAQGVAPKQAQDSATLQDGLKTSDANKRLAKPPNTLGSNVSNGAGNDGLLDPNTNKVVDFANIYRAPLFNPDYADKAEDPKIDESALRYYATQHDTKRVEAEIRRLKLFYPEWMPPRNLYANDTPTNDEQPLWDLFAADRLEDIHHLIDLRKSQNLDWEPSQELVRKLARQEARKALNAAYQQKAYAQILTIANDDPRLLDCAAMETNWRVAEAFAQLKFELRAYEIYQAILSSCTNRDERLATVRKAITRISMKNTNNLIASGRTLDTGEPEFASVKLDLIRNHISLIIGGAQPDDLSSEEIQNFTGLQKTNPSLADMALLGWYAIKHQDWAQAESYFATALSLGGDDKIVEGRILALQKLDRLNEAIALAHDWREKSELIRKLYISIIITNLTGNAANFEFSSNDFSDFVALVNTDHSIDGAQAIAWYRFNLKEYEEALVWFRTTLVFAAKDNDKPYDTLVRLGAKTGEGFLLALMEAGKLDEAETTAYAVLKFYDKFKPLYIDIATRLLNDDAQNTLLEEDRFTHIKQIIKSEKSFVGAQAVAWRHYRQKQWNEAIEWFRLAISWSSDGQGDAKINEGYALSLSAAGFFREAEEISYHWMGKSTLMADVFKSVMITQLTRIDLQSRMDEPRVQRFVRLVNDENFAEGAAALGWYRLSTRTCGYSVPWFKLALIWSPALSSDLKLQEGMINGLRQVGLYQEAEEKAYTYIYQSDALAKLYVTIMVQELSGDILLLPVTEARLSRFADYVTLAKSASGAQAIAWQRYRNFDCGYGVNWFKQAIQWSFDKRSDAKTNEGYALALRNAGLLDEAEAVAYDWQNDADIMRKLYIDIVVEELTRDNPPMPLPEFRLQHFMEIVQAQRSALGAQAIGWYRYERHETNEAAIWFRNALDWWPLVKGTPDAMSRVVDEYTILFARLALTRADYLPTPRFYHARAQADGLRKVAQYIDTPEGYAQTWTGYALAKRAAGSIDEAEKIAFAWKEKWPSLKNLFLEISITELTRQNRLGGLDEARLAKIIKFTNAEHSTRGAVALGWYYFGQKSYGDAANWFHNSIDWTLPTNYGSVDPSAISSYIIALRESGHIGDALSVAAEWRERSSDVKSIYVDTIIALLQNADQTQPLPMDKITEIEKIFASEKSPNGALSLGWYHFDRKEYSEALDWFRQSIGWSPDNKPAPKAVEGYGLALRALGRRDDALIFAYDWRVRVPAMLDSYIDLASDALSRHDPAAPLPNELLARLSAVAIQAKSSSAAQALAWFSYGRRDFNAAAAWFRSAISWSDDGKGDPKMVEGYILALRALNRFEDGENFLTGYYETSEGLRTLFIETVADHMGRKDTSPVTAQTMTNFAQIALQYKSAIAAQSLGWYSYNMKQYHAAAAWFQKAADWNASESVITGLVLAYRQDNDRANLTRILDQYKASYPKILDLVRVVAQVPTPTATPVPTLQPALARTQISYGQSPIAKNDNKPAPQVETRRARAPLPAKPTAAQTKASSLGAALQAKNYSACIETGHGLEASGKMTTNDYELFGWCLLNANRPEEAAAAFSHATETGDPAHKSVANYGKSLAQLKLGLSDGANSAINDANISDTNRDDLGAQVLAQKAQAAYAAGDYAQTISLLDRRASFHPEERWLMMMRGWSFYHLNRYGLAQKIFKAVDEQLSTKDSREALINSTNQVQHPQDQ